MTVWARKRNGWPRSTGRAERLDRRHDLGGAALPFVAIVEQRVEASAPARLVDRTRGRARRRVSPDDNDVDLERRDRPRPDDAVGIRELLDGGAGDARGTDPVAAHHDRPLLPGLVEV